MAANAVAPPSSGQTVAPAAMPPPAPQSHWQAGAQNRTRASFSDRLGYWVFSLLAMVVAPMFPMFVQWAKSHWSGVKTEDCLLTAAVLAIAYGFTSEKNLFRTAYGFLFLFSIGFDFSLEQGPGCAPALPEAVRPLAASVAHSHRGVLDWLGDPIVAAGGGLVATPR